MAEDKDIRERLKKSKTSVGKYATNVGKSFLHMGKYMVSSEMPTLFSYAEVNKEVVSSVADAIKNPGKILGSKYNQLAGSSEIVEIKKVIKYAMDDLKSGKFYDENRDRTNIGLETEAMLNDFGGLDMSDYGSDDFSPDGSTDSDRQFSLDLAGMQESNADSRASTTVEAMGFIGSAIIENDNANHDVDIRSRMRQHDQQMTGLNNIAMTGAANYEMTSHAYAEMLNMSKEVNTEILSKMDTMTSILSEIRDQGKKIEIVSTAALTNKIEELPFKNGALDIKKYINYVKKNIDNKYDVSGKVSMITQGMEIKELIELYKSNPIGGLMASAIRGLSPKDFFKDIKSFDDTLKAFLPSALMKVGGLQTKEGEDHFLQVLGVKARPYNSIKTDYNMGKVDFTGKTDKAITEVLPLLLGSINSALRNEPLKVYDYSRGVFVEAKGRLADIERSMNKHSNYISAKDRIMDNMKYVNSELIDTNKKKNDFQTAVSQYMDKLVDRQELMDLYSIDYEKNKGKMRDKAYSIFGASGNSLEKLNLLMGLIRGMDQKDLIAMPGSMMMRGLESESRIESLRKNLSDSGLLSLFSGIDSDVNDFASRARSNVYSSDGEIELAMKKAKNGKLTSLNDIKEILQRGIITYSYNLGNVSSHNNSGLNSFIFDEQKDVLYEMTRKIKEEKDREDNNRRYEHESLIMNSNAYGISGDASAELISSMIRELRMKHERGQENNIIQSNLFTGLFNENTTKNINNLKDVIAIPFNGILDTMSMTQNMMYRFLYGEDYDKMFNGKLSKDGVFTTLTTFFGGLFSKTEKTVRDVVGTKVVDPVTNYLFGKDNGKITGFISDKINPFIEKGMNKGKDFLFGKSKNRDKLNEFGERIYSRNQNGSVEYVMNELGEMVPAYVQESYRDGGMLSSFIDKAKGYGSRISQRGKEYKEHIFAEGKGMFGTLNSYFFGKEVDDEGNGKGLFTRMGESIKTGFDNFNKWLFGEDENGELSDSRKTFNEIKEELNKATPDIVIQAGIGAGAVGGIGLLTGLFLPGGPLMGALLGSVTGLVTGSEKVREFVFGEGGIDESVVEGFKKYAPKIGIGALSGSVLGTFGLLPFGLGAMGGAVAGSIGGMISASDELKEILFGNSDDNDSGLLSKNNREAFLKKVLPTGLLAGGGTMILSNALASGIGILPALPFLPHGPVVGMLAGLGAAFNADSVRDFFFGNGEVRDENGKPTGEFNFDKRGMFVKLFDTTRDHLFRPMLEGINNTGKSISSWFKEGIVNQLAGAMQPMKDEMAKARDSIRSALANIGDGIKSALSSVFENSLGKPLDLFMKENVYEPLRKHTSTIMKVAGKLVGGVISAPFRLINMMFNSNGTLSDTLSNEKNEKREQAFKDRQEKRKERIQKSREKRAISKMSPEDRADLRTKTITSRMGGLLAGLMDIKNAILGSPTDLVSESNKSPDAVFTSASLGKSKATDAKLERSNIIKSRKESRKKSSDEKRENKEARRKIREESRIKKMEEIDARREESAKKRSNKKSPERNIANISTYTEKISKFLENNISGIGYDVRYIRNMLLKQHGILDDSLLPENGPVSGKIPKKYSKFAKVGSFISDKLSGIRDFTYDKLDKAKGLLGYVLEPFKILKKATGTIIGAFGEVISETKHMFFGLLDTIFHTLKTGADALVSTVGNGIKAITNTIAGAAKGFGEGLGSVLKELGGAVGGLVGLLGGLTTGLAELAKSALPAIGHGLGKMIAGGTKFAIDTLGKGIKGGAKIVGKGLGWVGNKVFGNTKLASKTNIVNSSGVYILGGNLDGIIENKPIVRTGVFGTNFITELKQVAMMGSIAIGKSPKYALPVYIAGTYSDQPSILKDKKVKYAKYNRIVSKNDGSTMDKYDQLFNRARSQSDIDILSNVHALNSMNGLVNISSGESSVGEESEKGLNTGGLIGGILTATGLKGLMSKLFKSIKSSKFGNGMNSFIGKGVPTLISSIPLVLGTKMAWDNEDYGQVAENIGRAGIGLTEESAGEKAKRIASKIGSAKTVTTLKNGALKVGSKSAETSLLAKVRNMLASAIKKFLALKPVVAKLGSKVSAKLSTTIIGTISKRISASIVGRLGARMVRFLGGPATIAVFAVADFSTGMAEAANIFSVTGSNIDMKMRLTSGVAKAISGLTFGIIEPNAIAELIYPIIASDKETQELYQAQQAFSEIASDSGMTATEFNKNIENRTIGRKITDWFKDTFTKNKSDYYNYKNGITPGMDNGKGNGLGKYFTQTDSKWNTGKNSKYQINKAGCGPTVAAMMVNGLGEGADPVEASKKSFEFGDRDPDGGTNPNFFEKYGAVHGKNLSKGIPDANRVEETLKAGGKVAFMGKDDGSTYGKNMHYIMGDKLDSNGNVRVIDPLSKSPKKASVNSLVTNAKSVVYGNGKGIGDAVSGFLDSFSSGIDKAVAFRFGLPIPSNSEDESGTTGGTVNPGLSGVSLGSDARSKILQKLFEIICNTEGGADGYYAISNDKNASTGKTVGPSLGIMQWHAGRITNIMKNMYTNLSTNPIARKWAQYNWSADIPLSLEDLNEIRSYLKSNISIAKKVQDTIAMRELQTTLLDRVYADGRLTDPRAIILLADIGNTGPARIQAAIDSHFGSGGENSFESVYKFLSTVSWWATSKLSKGYKNRIKKVYNILKKWNPPTVSLKNIKEWFLKGLKGSKISQEFGVNPNNGYNGPQGHRGIDFSAPSGTPVPSPVTGKVTVNKYEAKGFGNYIKVGDQNNMSHIFGHLKNKSPLKVGDNVNIGDIVGLIGTTGASTGNHLHYEIRDAKSVSHNPALYFNGSTTSENGKGVGYNSNTTNDIARSTNNKIKNYKKEVETKESIDELSRKIDRLSNKNNRDENGTGGQNPVLENISTVLESMVKVLQAIETNTRTSSGSSQTNVNIGTNNDLPRTTPKKDKSISSGMYAIDALTAR